MVAGLALLMLNIGSKYIPLNFSENQEGYLKHGLARQMLIFSIAFIDVNEYAWFLMDLQRFSMSKMFAKLIKHSFWRPRTPCTFRVVRFALTRFSNGSASSNPQWCFRLNFEGF